MFLAALFSILSCLGQAIVWEKVALTNDAAKGWNDHRWLAAQVSSNTVGSVVVLETKCDMLDTNWYEVTRFTYAGNTTVNFRAVCESPGQFFRARIP